MAVDYSIETQRQSETCSPETYETCILCPPWQDYCHMLALTLLTTSSVRATTFVCFDMLIQTPLFTVTIPTCLRHVVTFGNEKQSQRDAPADHVYNQLRHAVRLYWLPTLARLRKIRSPNGPSSSSTLLKGAWVELGHAFGLSEDDPCSSPTYIDDLEQLIPPPYSWAGCFSKECPCYGRKPLHSMLSCKGCSIAVYCSPRC